MTNRNDPSSSFAFDTSPAAGLMQHNLEFTTAMLRPILASNITILNWNASNCKRIAQAYSQWFDFVGHRFEEEAKLAEQLRTTKDPQAMSNAYSKFLETATEDYRNEFAELTNLSREMTNGAADILKDIEAKTAGDGKSAQ